MTSTVEVVKNVTSTVEVAAPGVQGPPGSGGGSTMVGHPTFIQQTDPALTTPYVWYQTDGTGTVIEIYVGP